MSTAEDLRPANNSPLSRQWLWAVILFIAMTWVFWDFLQRQVLFAVKKQADWGHTLVIPFIAGYFVWLIRGRLCEQPFRIAWSGLVPFILGLAWYTICGLGPTTLHHHNLMGVGVCMAVFGMVLFIFGWRAMRYLLFPLLYLFVFGQTISDRMMEVVTFKLQDIAALGSYHGLSLVGLDVTRAGNTLEIFHGGVSHPLNIAEACSGMRMLMAFFALGVAMAFAGLRFWWQRIALVLMALPTAVFVNILRVMTLGLLSLADSNFAAGDFHTFIGTLWLVPAFMIYLGIVWLLRNLVIVEGESRPDTDSATATFRWPATRGFIIATVLLGMSAVVFQVGVHQLNIFLRKEPVHLRHQLSNIPSQIGRWQASGDDLRLDEAGVEALGTDRYLSRRYVAEVNGRPVQVQVHIAYYTGQIDAIPHIPDRCLVAGGFVPKSAEPATLPLTLPIDSWREDPEHALAGEHYRYVRVRDPEGGRREKVRMPVGEIRLRTTEFSHPQAGDGRIFAGYFFVANGRTTPFPERIRLLAFDRTSRAAYYCKVQFTIHGDALFGEERFIEMTSEIAADLLPVIMQCLPDWVEVTTAGDKNEDRG
ncbi:MAG: exosortase/archaeosortase family protein [Phycisphaerales bacterium]|nr:exosortase/archaeosortase family protein [Phycisphaerales bacterium]